MGREGVAYTFVTPEEGGELTRIEMLINRLLKRDEIEGFSTVATAAPTAAAAQSSATDAAPDEPEEPKPPRPLPPGRRPPKRHRRGLIAARGAIGVRSEGESDVLLRSEELGHAERFYSICL